MNIKRKAEIQERRIASLQKEINKLKNENYALRLKNEELLNKDEQHRELLNTVEEMRNEYLKSIEEIHAIKEQYLQAVYEAQQMKKNFTKKFKPLLKRLKTEKQ